MLRRIDTTVYRLTKSQKFEERLSIGKCIAMRFLSYVQMPPYEYMALCVRNAVLIPLVMQKCPDPIWQKTP